jgi:hypothetical protein
MKPYLMALAAEHHLDLPDVSVNDEYVRAEENHTT